MMPHNDLSADEIIALLELEPHPEGGFYRQTFRDLAEGASGRAASTLIYFLLKKDQISAWHRIDAAEVWHYYAGAPLELSLSDDGKTTSSFVLGADLRSGQRPQAIVPPGAWQSARSTGEWTLLGCTVSPGFEFEYFELADQYWKPGT